MIDEARCASCLTCFRVCPLQAVQSGETMFADPARCHRKESAQVRLAAAIAASFCSNRVTHWAWLFACE